MFNEGIVLYHEQCYLLNKRLKKKINENKWLLGGFLCSVNLAHRNLLYYVMWILFLILQIRILLERARVLVGQTFSQVNFIKC